MRVLSWNIAGGHTFSGSISDAMTYEEENLDYFIYQIKNTDADIVFLQETHATEKTSQGQIITKRLAYKYFREHTYIKSHIKKDSQLTLATLSKYPIHSSYFHAAPNPNLTIKRPNGQRWVTYDMGFLVTEMSFNDRKVNFANCHFLPFHYFKRDFLEPAFQNIRENISSFLIRAAEKPSIFGGDYNYSDLRKIVQGVFTNSLYKDAFANVDTTPGKGQQDHILYSHQWNLVGFQVEKVTADHYKCIADFTLDAEPNSA